MFRIQLTSCSICMYILVVAGIYVEHQLWMLGVSVAATNSYYFHSLLHNIKDLFHFKCFLLL